MADPYFSSVSLLLHCNGTNGGTTFNDVGPLAKTPTRTGITTSTTQKKWGSASASSSTSGTYLTLDGSADFAFGTGDYTVEFWIYPTGLTTSHYLYDGRPSAGTGVYPVIYVTSVGALKVEINEVAIITSSNGAIVTNSWQHVAFSRSGSSTKLFVNGTQVGSTYSGSENLLNGTSRPAICQFGNNLSNPNGLSGYMDDIRVTKGVARYTANFTAPAAEFEPRDPIKTAMLADGLVTVSPTSIQRKPVKYSLLADGQVIVLPVSTVKRTIPLSGSSQINYSDTHITNFEFFISELVSIVDNYSTKVITSDSVNDTVLITDLIKAILNGSISESISLTSTAVATVKYSNIILESIVNLTTLSSVAILINSVSELINILDSLKRYIDASASESISLVSTQLNLQIFLNSIIESITIVDTLTPKTQGVKILTDAISITSTSSTKAVLSYLISDGFIISIPTAKGHDKYLAYLLSPDTSYVTNYTNFPFDVSAVYNSKCILGNSTGLYEMGGTTDAGSAIRSYIETAATSFGTTSLKSVPHVYVGVRSDNSLYVKVRVDGKGEFTYKLNKFSDGLSTQKIDLGKGLKGRYFQFELVSDAANFSLESVSFYPVELRRKL